MIIQLLTTWTSFTHKKVDTLACISGFYRERYTIGTSGHLSLSLLWFLLCINLQKRWLGINSSQGEFGIWIWNILNHETQKCQGDVGICWCIFIIDLKKESLIFIGYFPRSDHWVPLFDNHSSMLFSYSPSDSFFHICISYYVPLCFGHWEMFRTNFTFPLKENVSIEVSVYFLFNDYLFCIYHCWEWRCEDYKG